MIAILFEVIPAEDQRETYLDMAARLRPELAQIDGFLSVERFQSLTNPDKLLSLSFFANEDAVRAWRARQNHQSAQSRGRGGVFRTYRLRVAQVLRDYGPVDRTQAPQP